MFYNPNFKICDWPANVRLIRPECSIKQTTLSKETEFTRNTTTSYENTLMTTYRKKVTTTSMIDTNYIKCI